MTDNTWPTVDTELIDDVTLYSAKLIIPVTGPVIIDGAVAIHGDRVVHVGKRRWVLEALKQEMTSHGTIRERHWDGVLTPGLVNAHTHLQYSGMVQVGQGPYDRFRAWELAFNEVYAEASHGSSGPRTVLARWSNRERRPPQTSSPIWTPPARWLRRACTASLIGR